MGETTTVRLLLIFDCFSNDFRLTLVDLYAQLQTSSAALTQRQRKECPFSSPGAFQ